MNDLAATPGPPATSPELPRRALVVGLGVSGRAAAAALLEAGVEVTAVDEGTPAAAAEELRARGGTAWLEARPEDHLGEVGLVVLSPGVPESAPVVTAAAERGLPVWSEPELAWCLARPERLLGVTGTNGKTSVTELVTAMLTEGGIAAMACGNIGTPLVAVAAGAAPGTVLVAELSSFQLRFCHRLRPAVGALLNVAPDHLDWHGDAERYARAKARLWQAQRADDWAVTNAADDTARRLAEAHAPGRVAAFSGRGPVEPPGVGIVDDGLVAELPGLSGRILETAALSAVAPHHLANVAAAAVVALLAGAEPAAVAAAAATFSPGRHRLERVARHGGVTWVDDSKATNPHAAAAALAAFDRVVWIAGGVAKGVGLGPLGEHLGGVRHAVLLGEAAPALAEVCADTGVPATRVGSMDEAVQVAAGIARPGDTVLLAPACASFDLFDDYHDRGRRFAAAVRALEEDARG